MLEKIETLRNGRTPNKIESLLLAEKLGEIRTRSDGYQFIENYPLSWLVVEIHNSGFIDWMTKHPYKYVVHHIDGDILNNIYENLRVMKWGSHVRLHMSAYYADLVNAETIEARGKKRSNWCADPANAEAIEASGRKYSEWFADKANAETIKARNKAMSKTKRKSWPDLLSFKQFFTTDDYAEVGKVGYGTANYRLKMLLSEGQITCEKKLVDERWSNIYRSVC